MVSTAQELSCRIPGPSTLVGRWGALPAELAWPSHAGCVLA